MKTVDEWTAYALNLNKGNSSLTAIENVNYYSVLYKPE